MNTTTIRMTAVAHLTATAFALVPVPVQARAAIDATDRDEIPPFVLERIDLVSGTGRVGC